MKRQQSRRLHVESLENKALLTTSALPHAAIGAAVPALVEAMPTTDVSLRGGIVSGRGYVSPLGQVRGQYILVQRTLTLTNKRGALELQLSDLHRYPNVVRFTAWQIIQGTGKYATWAGSGRGSFTLVIVGKRAVASSAAFY